MLDFGFYNLDCMEGMKDYPDNYFDLAVVDPPYGGGLTENGGCQGWFSKYHQETPENSGGGYRNITTVSDNVSTDTNKTGRVARKAQIPRGKLQKNHNVGYSPRQKLFSRAFSCLT